MIPAALDQALARGLGLARRWLRPSRLGQVLLVVAAVLLLRLPFLANPMVGEEGAFAYLVASPVPSSRYTPDHRPQMLIGQIGQQPMLYPFQHAIIPYVVLETGVGTVLRAAGAASRSARVRTIAVRSAYLVLFMLGCGGLLWFASGNLLAAAIGGFALSTPLLVGASIQPQVDGGMGVLLIGGAGALLAWQRSTGQVLRAALAGVLVGVGRQEWAMAFLAASALQAGVTAAVTARVAVHRGNPGSTLAPQPRHELQARCIVQTSIQKA